MGTTEQDVLTVEVDDQAPIIYQFGVTAKMLSGTVLQINYNGLPNRDPGPSGDFIAIWQNPGVIPFGKKPLQTQQVAGGSPDGSVNFKDLQLSSRPYVVGYSAGSNADGHNIAVAVPIMTGGTQGPETQITIGLASVGSTSLAISYTTPAAEKPKTFGHQLVLVQGETYFPDQDPLAKTTPSDSTNDIASFNNVNMVIDQWYTVAYLAGAAGKNLAATCAFQVTAS